MSCETQTAVTLRYAGQKITPQRVLILSSVRHASQHVTASDVLKDVRRSYGYVDASTVYRTLAAARDLGLVSETHLGSGDHEFEWVGTDRHHHLICSACETVFSLDAGHLAGLATALYDELGFQADLRHFAISGVCKDCRDRSRG